jgi:hypothetical protein
MGRKRIRCSQDHAEDGSSFARDETLEPRDDLAGRLRDRLSPRTLAPQRGRDASRPSGSGTSGLVVLGLTRLEPQPSGLEVEMALHPEEPAAAPAIPRFGYLGGDRSQVEWNSE